MMAELKESEGVEVKRFTEDQREYLEYEGYSIYELTGKSLGSLSEMGFVEDISDLPGLAEETSMKGEVAIKPRHALYGSGGGTLAEQQRQVDQLSKYVGSTWNLKGMIGKAADYFDLASMHLDKTGEDLFGPMDRVRTTTRTRIEKDESSWMTGGEGTGDALVVIGPGAHGKNKELDIDVVLEADDVDGGAAASTVYPLLIPA